MKEENKRLIGRKLAEFLKLKFHYAYARDEENRRYDTTWGDKTDLGLYECINRIIEEDQDQFKPTSQYWKNHYIREAGKYYLEAGRTILKDGQEACAVASFSDAKKALSNVEKDCMAHYLTDVLNGVAVPSFQIYFTEYMK